MMECAALSSSLNSQSRVKAVLLHRFGERRVRPLSHLIVRQQTWQETVNSVVVAGLRMWESRMRFPSLASARRHLQASQAVAAPANIGGRYGSFLASTAQAMRASLLANATAATLG